MLTTHVNQNIRLLRMRFV